jgi:hypothetical protein
MSAWVLIATTAWQLYSGGVWTPAISVAMQEFATQSACGRAADAMRSQIAEQVSGYYGKDRASVRAICVPKEVK